MSNLNEKTNIPLAWAVSILVALAGALFNAGMGWAKFSALDEKVATMQLRNAQEAKQRVEQAMKIQRLDITLESMNKKLESIDKKLDRKETK